MSSLAVFEGTIWIKAMYMIVMIENQKKGNQRNFT